MKDILDPMNHSSETEVVWLPDWLYIKQAIYRHFWRSLLVSAVVLVLGAVIYQNYSYVYSATASLSYRPKDTHLPVDPFEDSKKFLVLEKRMMETMEDPDFLLALAKRLGAQPTLDFFHKMGEWTYETGVKLKLNKPLTDKDRDEKLKETLIGEIAGNLKLESVPDQYRIKIIGSWTTPEEAQQLAFNFMQQFVEMVLKEEIAMTSSSLQILGEFVEQQRLNADETEKMQAAIGKASSTVGQPPARTFTQSEQEKYLQNEAKLLDAIDRARSNLETMNSTLMGRKMELQEQLAAMRHRYEPTHPAIIELQSELASLEKVGQQSRGSNDLQELRAQLAMLHAQMKKGGMKVTYELVGSNDMDPKESFVDGITRKILSYKLEKDYLSRQLNDFAFRTKYIITMELAKLKIPTNNKKKKLLLVATVMLAGMCSVILALVTDYADPLLRGKWLVMNKAGKMPIFGEFSAKNFSDKPLAVSVIKDNLPLLSLRGKADKGRRGAEIVAYRSIVEKMKQHQVRKVPLFVMLGADKESSVFVSNLLNVMAFDQGGEHLLLDFNSQNPTAVPAEPGWHHIGSFFAGQAKWSEVLHRKDDDHGYDFAVAPQSPSAVKLKSRTVQKFLENLQSMYQSVFINGFEPAYFTENSALLEAGADCVIFVNLKNATKDELDVTLRNTPSEKVRGVIFLNS
jgi:hypothetical protein